MKKCSKCKVEKELVDFGKDKSSKDGLYTTCKECCKEYRLENKERRKKYNKEYRLKNKERINQYEKEYRNTNKEKLNENNKKYIKERKKIDPLYKLKGNVSSLIRVSFRTINGRKSTMTTEILGCSLEDFKIHLEKQFEDWMDWSNYGNPVDNIFELNKSWDIDHIIPLSTAETKEDIIKLNHYSNLQPLCSYENRFIKRDNT
jgi:hypothetical protein